jgi:queuine tRNA-ribosyltransferase
MADSGGYQAFSLGEMARVDDGGITFRYPIDGSTHRFTPESVMNVQSCIGADLIMPLDVCTEYPTTFSKARADMEQTHKWAARSQAVHDRGDQLLYGVVQGSVFPELRAESAEHIASLGFQAMAIGGVSVGESKQEMRSVVRSSVSALPEEAPRHLLGVGHPDDLVASIASGIDTFDCVMPTRVARNGAALTNGGRINLRNAAHSLADTPIDDDCRCYACRQFSRAAIRHFVKSDEILGLHLLTLHNLHFTLDLMRRARLALVEGTFPAFVERFGATYRPER